MYSKDLNRLFEGMKTFGGQVQLGADTVIRYEYWVTEDNPTSAWSLNKNAGLGMRNAGLVKWWQGNHRIVICRAGIPRNSRSKIILRANAIATQFPFVAEVANLVGDIQERAMPEKGEGPGDAAETFLTDIFAPIAGMFG
jgi:hypothetical protein